jgi:hypothetical protein
MRLGDTLCSVGIYWLRCLPSFVLLFCGLRQKEVSLRSSRPRIQQGHIAGEVAGIAGNDGEVVLEGGGGEEADVAFGINQRLGTPHPVVGANGPAGWQEDD